jgi:hypothetical protein
MVHCEGSLLTRKSERSPFYLTILDMLCNLVVVSWARRDDGTSSFYSLGSVLLASRFPIGTGGKEQNMLRRFTAPNPKTGLMLARLAQSHS